MMNGQNMKTTKTNALSGKWVQDGEEGWSKIGSKSQRGLKGRQRAIPFLHHGPHTIQKVVPSGWSYNKTRLLFYLPLTSNKLSKWYHNTINLRDM
jgi:hypothetical protein